MGDRKSPRLWLIKRSYLSYQTTFASEYTATEDIIILSKRCTRFIFVGKDAYVPTIRPRRR